MNAVFTGRRGVISVWRAQTWGATIRQSRQVREFSAQLRGSPVGSPTAADSVDL